MGIVATQIGHLKLDEIHDESLRPYVHRRRQRVSVGTVKKEIGVVRRILNLAWSTWSTADGYPYVRRVRALTVPKGETRRPWPISQYEEARLLRELPTHLAEIAVFMLNTGIRTGELLNLQWEWERKIEDTSLSVFVLPEEFVKSGKARIVILNSIAQRILESNRDNQSTHVFTYRGKPWKGAKLTNSAWKSARKRAGLQHVRVHDLRHTYGARLRAAGVSHEDRQDLLGHESGSMTTHYSAASIQRLQSEAEKVIGSDPLLLDRQASWMGQKRGSSALVVGSAG